MKNILLKKQHCSNNSMLILILFILLLSQNAYGEKTTSSNDSSLFTEPLIITAGSTPASCNGSNDGTASALASGGTAPYTFLWTESMDSIQSVSLNPQKDNTIYQQNTGNSNGAGEYLAAGTTASFFINRALIGFDITGNIPSGSVIIGTKLTLHLSNSSGPSGIQDHTLYKMTQDWGEGNSDASSDAGQGAPATSNDATWIKNFFPGSDWLVPGGSFDAASRATTAVNAVGFYDWTSPLLVADVQEWLDIPASNFGWILRSKETTNQQAKRYDSRQNATPANRPVLTVNYLSNVISMEESLTNLKPGYYNITVIDAAGNIASESVLVSEPAALVPIVTDTVTCNAYTWLVNGETYPVSGSFNDTIGCQPYLLNLTIETCCSVPATLNTTNITDQSADLNWSAISGATKYKIQYKKSMPGESLTTKTAFAPATTYHLTGLLPSTKYKWKIRSVCGTTGNSAFSAFIKFTTAASRNEFLYNRSNERTELQIFPNPATQHFTIDLKLAESINESVTIEIRNMMGQLVYSTQAYISNGMLNGEINIPVKLSNGNYTVIASNCDNHVTGKLVIQNER